MHAGEDVGNNPQEIIAHYARVSNPTNQRNHATSGKLVDYLIRKSEWSPLEMCSAELKVTTSRDVARQILRHRSFAFQEFSQRYADPTKQKLVLRGARLQDTKNRQNSIENDDADLELGWRLKQSVVADYAVDAYEWAIANGIAKEQARVVLPEGLTSSTMYMSGSFRSWIHYVGLRTRPETQKEHREVAHACAKALQPIFPKIADFVYKGE